MSTFQIIATTILAILTAFAIVYCLMIEKSQRGFFVMVRELLPYAVVGDSFSAKVNRMCLTYSFAIFSTLLTVCFFAAIGWMVAAGLSLVSAVIGFIKLPAMRRVYKLA